jgi:hypothetical protein
MNVCSTEMTNECCQSGVIFVLLLLFFTFVKKKIFLCLFSPYFHLHTFINSSNINIASSNKNIYLKFFTIVSSISDEVIDLILPTALWPRGSTQPLTEISTRHLRGGKGRPARKGDSLTAICKPNV